MPPPPWGCPGGPPTATGPMPGPGCTRPWAAGTSRSGEDLEKKVGRAAHFRRHSRIDYQSQSTECATMSVADPQVMTIFCEALEHRSPQERAAYLDQACGPDPGLRAR